MSHAPQRTALLFQRLPPLVGMGVAARGPLAGPRLTDWLPVGVGTSAVMTGFPLTDTICVLVTFRPAEHGGMSELIPRAERRQPAWMIPLLKMLEIEAHQMAAIYLAHGCSEEI